MLIPQLAEVCFNGWRGVVEMGEVVPLSSERVALFHTFTWTVKCWAQYLSWLWWPALASTNMI
uniref:Uncharacterized protein n=1 Tax=Globisporangium ultimum (strain ATCC 200006 / CBS 805.95 / DAOM BR144) TaxID=431595 RepID=K3WES8_GLOUD